MAKTRSKGQGKHATLIKKKKGPDSRANVKKIKTLDAILGVEPVEPLIKQQEDIRKDFGLLLGSNCAGCNSVQGNNTIPTDLRYGSIKKNLEKSFANENLKTKVKITDDDINEEVEFWKPSIVCYVLGANPPLQVLEGFARRMWRDEVERVGMLLLVVMKPWDPEVNFKREDIRMVPIWVHLDDLELKYRGERSLIKIIGQIGKPIKVDEATKRRDKLSFPRVLIEVSLQQEYPELIEFEDEKGCNTTVAVTYEWKPLVCSHCSGMGHLAVNCRKKVKRKQEWIVKAPKKQDKEEVKVDAEGFQLVTRGWKPKETEKEAAAGTSNSFQILQEM
uniref:DUF4283 domain-containing protein n=1 Tax=Cannabis sativa TaxID=3483 RepID=A0A803NJX8_CANSA